MKPHYYPSQIKRILAKSAERAKTHERILALLNLEEGIETAALADLVLLDRRRVAATLCWLESQGKVSRMLEWTNERRVPYSLWKRKQLFIEEPKA